MPLKSMLIPLSVPMTQAALEGQLLQIIAANTSATIAWNKSHPSPARIDDCHIRRACLLATLVFALGSRETPEVAGARAAESFLITHIADLKGLIAKTEARHLVTSDRVAIRGWLAGPAPRSDRRSRRLRARAVNS